MAFRPGNIPRSGGWDWRRSPNFPAAPPAPAYASAFSPNTFAETAQAAFDTGAPTADVRYEHAPAHELIDSPLGAARTQIHENY
ncbi:hypothetical protein ABTN45_20140, partial [Acinetobacter baumannii]